MDAVIHLACVSNDPSFELDPSLENPSIFDAIPGFLRAVQACAIKRLIYASSSSVYGVKKEPNVREEATCEPLTDYSKFKWNAKVDFCIFLETNEYVLIRPATVCGYAPRLRLDLSVNILTIHALIKKEITVFGGSQLRPNLNIKDMIEAYRVMLEAPTEKKSRAKSLTLVLTIFLSPILPSLSKNRSAIFHYHQGTAHERYPLLSCQFR